MSSKTTTGTRTKPKRTTAGTKAKNTTKPATKANKAINDKVIDITDKESKRTAKPETFDKLELPEQPKDWKDRHSPTIGNNGFDLQPGDNTKVINDMLYIYQMPKIDISDDEAVQDRIFEYFQYCAGRDIRPGVEGMAMALGVNRRTLWEWEEGNRRGNSVVRADIIRKSKQFLALYLENLAQTGHINPVTAIFLMKNHFQYKDAQDLVITPNNALQPTMSMEQITQKAKDDVVIDPECTE